MSTLVVYSSLSGNTKSVCERIYGALTGKKKIISVQEVKDTNIDLYENIVIGFWCDKGTMDKNSLDFVSTLKNKNLSFLGTLGARPDSDHGKDVFKTVKELCEKENSYKGGLLIWGRISKELKDRIMQLPADHPHGPTPERLERWRLAEPHPDENDFKEAEEYFSKLLNK
ncbi:MAG: flavodoxin [Fusobacterium sp.]|nr:flavodoxin [Fusobacterium sp.]